jgi:integrase
MSAHFAFVPRRDIQTSGDILLGIDRRLLPRPYTATKILVSRTARKRPAKSCLARLCATAEIEDVTPHTLRHTFGSVAGDLGFSELTIAALLGHAARGVTRGYIHIDEALKLAASRTCEEIAGLLPGQESLPAKTAA